MAFEARVGSFYASSQVAAILLWSDESMDMVVSWVCNFNRAIGSSFDNSTNASYVPVQIYTFGPASRMCATLFSRIPKMWTFLSVNCFSPRRTTHLDFIHRLHVACKTFDRILISAPNVVFLGEPWSYLQSVQKLSMVDSGVASVFLYSVSPLSTTRDRTPAVPALFVHIEDRSAFLPALKALNASFVSMGRGRWVGFSKDGLTRLGMGLLEHTCSAPGASSSRHLSQMESVEHMGVSCRFLSRVSFASTEVDGMCRYALDDLYVLGAEDPSSKLIALHVPSWTNEENLRSLLIPKGFLPAPDGTHRALCPTILHRLTMSRLLHRVVLNKIAARPLDECPLPQLISHNQPPVTPPHTSAIQERLHSRRHLQQEEDAKQQTDETPNELDPGGAFLKIAGERASPTKKTIMLLVTNRGFLPFFHNLMCWYRSLDFDPERSHLTQMSYVVVALDEMAHEILQAEGHPVFYTGNPMKEVLDPLKSYRTKDYNEIVKQKTVYLHYLVQSGFNVLLADLDLVFYSDPTVYIKNTTEVLISEDDPSFWGRNLNTGFLFFRSTTCSERFLQNWIQYNERSKRQEDQQVFNSHLDEFMMLNIDSIPRGKYLSTMYRTKRCRCLAADAGAVVGHWNWINGAGRKMGIMRRWGDWLYEGNGTSCQSPPAFSCYGR